MNEKVRNSKSEDRMKSKSRIPKTEESALRANLSDFEFRTSFGFRNSARRMTQPDALKKNEALLWSSGRGTDQPKNGS